MRAKAVSWCMRVNQSGCAAFKVAKTGKDARPPGFVLVFAIGALAYSAQAANPTGGTPVSGEL